jgi:hypothetical protein
MVSGPGLLFHEALTEDYGAGWAGHAVACSGVTTVTRSAQK